MKASRLATSLIAALVVALSTWLLVGDAHVNASAAGQARAPALSKASRARLTPLQGYGYNSICRPQFTRAVSTSGFISKGLVRCVDVSNGSGTALNAFLGTAAGGLQNMTNNEPLRCSDGSTDCGTTGSCLRASMGDLEVSPDGRIVSFVSDGSPAEASNNTGHHGFGFFAFVGKGKGKGNKLVGGGDAFCAPNTSNHGAACTKESDCGTVCGNGRIEGNEQCDGGGYGGACPAGQFCAPPGSANQCTCQVQMCGNGIREGTEQCDGPGTCGPNSTCNAQCLCVPTG